MAAAANDPGAASGVLAPPSCGVPSGTPRRSSLRSPLSLPGSFASLTMITPDQPSHVSAARGPRDHLREAKERREQRGPRDHLREAKERRANSIGSLK